MIKKKTRPQGELVYGIHAIAELLKAKRRKVYTLYTTKPVPKQWNLIESLMPTYPVQLQYVDRSVLTNMVATTDHQGVVAWVQSFVYRKKAFETQKSPFLLLLDSIQDPRNLGAILRSAYCTGVDGVIITTRNAAPLNAVAYKSSAGLAEYLEIMQVGTAKEALQIMATAGYTVYLAMLQGADATSISYEMPLCVVIGNEAVGISPALRSFGTPITLPQKSMDVSYNASVAAGILLFMIGTACQIIGKK